MGAGAGDVVHWRQGAVPGGAWGQEPVVSAGLRRLGRPQATPLHRFMASAGSPLSAVTEVRACTEVPKCLRGSSTTVGGGTSSFDATTFPDREKLVPW